MKLETFFKPTPTYKEYLLLSMIANNPNITQRDIAKEIEISVAMVNMYVNNYEKEGLLKRTYSSTRNVEYLITDKGEKRRKLLNIQYLESSLNVYNEAKTDCNKFFEKIIEKGYRNILFYGGGEAAEIMLLVLNAENPKLNVVAIIDDDIEKQGKTLMGRPIISDTDINKYKYDGILISSYNNSKEIYRKLLNKNLNENKILQFFEM